VPWITDRLLIIAAKPGPPRPMPPVNTGLLSRASNGRKEDGGDVFIVWATTAHLCVLTGVDVVLLFSAEVLKLERRNISISDCKL
jgi:hypothetical protein